MSSIFFDDSDYIDELRAEARIERQRRRSATQCQCGNDLPGSCPGPENCPCAATDDDHNEGENEE